MAASQSDRTGHNKSELSFIRGSEMLKECTHSSTCCIISYHRFTRVQQYDKCVNQLIAKIRVEGCGTVSRICRAMLNMQACLLKTMHDQQYRSEQPVLLLVPFELDSAWFMMLLTHC